MRPRLGALLRERIYILVHDSIDPGFSQFSVLQYLVAPISESEYAIFEALDDGVVINIKV